MSRKIASGADYRAIAQNYISGLMWCSKWLGFEASHQNKLRAYIQYIGTVALTCDSWHCTWEQWPMHHTQRSKRKAFWEIKFDIFNLLAILDAVEHELPYPRRLHNLGLLLQDAG